MAPEQRTTLPVPAITTDKPEEVAELPPEEQLPTVPPPKKTTPAAPVDPSVPPTEVLIQEKDKLQRTASATNMKAIDILEALKKSTHPPKQ